MLLYPDAGVDVLRNFRVGGSERGLEKVNVTVLGPESFGGEFFRRSHAYIVILWLVSVWAMITNSSQAIFRLVFSKRQKKFSQILWEMGRDPKHISSVFVDRFNSINHEAKYGAAGWRSLKIFYNYHSYVRPKLKGIEGFMSRWWMEKMENRQAVTNRYKIAVDLLEQAFRRFAQEKEIRLISIASGSAQAVIEAMKRCPDLNIKAILIDVDKTAIEQSQKAAAEVGFSDRFKFIRGTTKQLDKLCNKPHIIEMIGFLDYRPDDKAIALIKKIWECLALGGVFLTCNIRMNRERIFLSWTLLWPMIYRSEKQLARLLLAGGFEANKTELIYEPFRIHGIGLCLK